MHHDGGVRHFTPAPDAVVVQRGDDTMVELWTFDPVSGRMGIERTVHRDGEIRHASYFVRLPTPPEWVVWLEAAGSATCGSRPAAAGPSRSTAGRWWSWPRPEGPDRRDAVTVRAGRWAPEG